MQKKFVVGGAVAALLLGITASAYLMLRPKVAFVGFADQTLITVEKAAAKAGMRYRAFIDTEVDQAESQPPRLNAFKVIFVNARRSQPYPKPLEDNLRAAANKGARIVVLPAVQRGMMDFANVDLRGNDKTLGEYFNNGGVENWTRMFGYVSRNFLGSNSAVLPPLVLPDDGFYHPDAPDVIPSPAAYRDWYQKSGKWKEARPLVAIDFANGWRSGHTASLDSLIRVLEKRGMNVAAYFGFPERGTFLGEWKPDVVLNRSHGRFFQGDAGVALMASRVDAPLIRSLSLQFDRKTVSEYRETHEGLRGAGLTIGTVVSELDGTVAPILTEGLEKDSQGRKLQVGIPERIERLADRVEKWARLRHTANHDKKIAIVYFAGMGKSEFTGAGLNVPRSLIRFLKEMKAAGYTINNPPAEETQLLRLMMDKGRNISEQEPGELERFLASGDVTLVPADEYGKWFDSLPASLRQSVIAAYGPAPGTFMVARREGKDYLVIPGFRFGNVVLLPQPARGAKMDAKLQHSDTVPPPHQYLAVYYWLQHSFAADAVVHYGTHGTYEFLPGRPVGQLDDDWSDQVVGSLPGIYVYTMDNVGEALLAKRRGVAVMVSHQTPPIVPAQLSVGDNDLASLYRMTQQFAHTEEGTLKQRMREQVRALAVKRKLDRDMRLDWTANAPTDDQILALDQYLDDLEEAKIPVGLHTHGVANRAEELSLTVTEILGRPFVEQSTGQRNLEGAGYRAAKLQAAKLVSDMLRQPPPADPPPPAPVVQQRSNAGDPPEGAPRPAGPVSGRAARRASPSGGVAGKRETSAALLPRRAGTAQEYRAQVQKLRSAFAETANEIPATLRALDGKYVRPGGGGDPARAPQALPTGRNLYGVNPAEIPTKVAWDVGVKLADELVAAERKRLGRYPRKIGFNLWPTEVIRQYGSDLASILWLLGVTPVWDERGIIVDLAVIPATALGRPRIDVVVQAAGQFRDSFPDRMELIDKAVHLAAIANDAENFIASNANELETELKKQGMSAKDAKTYSLARVFSNGVGGYGTGLTGSIAKSAAYTDTKSLTEEYLERSGAVYSGGSWGAKIPALYESALKNVDAVSISNSSNTVSALTLDHYFEYLGGMTMAIRDKHNQNAAAYVADTRDPDRTRSQTLEAAMAQDFRTTLWNRKWIAGMKDQEFSGASEVTKLTTNLWGWQVTRPESVQEYMWKETYEIYVKDREGMGLKDWFDSRNAFAYQVMTATMLEAIRKGYWKADAETTRTLATEYASSLARHGSSGSDRTAGNTALTAFVKKNLEAPGNLDGIKLSRAFTDAMSASTSTQAGTLVAGQRLVKAVTIPLTQLTPRNSLLAAGMCAMVALFWLGLRRRS